MVITDYKLYTDKHFSQMKAGRFTIGLVSDLHETDPGEVLALLKKTKPDIICVSGDSLERHDTEKGKDPRTRENYSRFSALLYKIVMLANDCCGLLFQQRKTVCPENVYRFLRESSRIAPVYMSLGNHEWYLLPEDREIIRQTGVILLDNEFRDLGGLRIGGLSSAMDKDFLDRFSEDDKGRAAYRVLLCHHPEYYRPYLKSRGIDLILSGHAHGGQIRIFGRGLLAPGQGFLPKYHHGVYDHRLVLSAGCANTASVPRWGNPTELVVIHLIEKEES